MFVNLLTQRLLHGLQVDPKRQKLLGLKTKDGKLATDEATIADLAIKPNSKVPSYPPSGLDALAITFEPALIQSHTCTWMQLSSRSACCIPLCVLNLAEQC